MGNYGKPRPAPVVLPEQSDGGAAVAAEPSRHATSGASLDARLNSMGNGTCRRLNAAAEGSAGAAGTGDQPSARAARAERHRSRRRHPPHENNVRLPVQHEEPPPPAGLFDDLLPPAATTLHTLQRAGSSVEDWSKLQLDLGNQSTRAGSAAVQSGGFDTTDLAIAAAATTVREADSLHTRRRRHRSLKARSEGQALSSSAPSAPPSVAATEHTRHHSRHRHHSRKESSHHHHHISDHNWAHESTSEGAQLKQHLHELGVSSGGRKLSGAQAATPAKEKSRRRTTKEKWLTAPSPRRCGGRGAAMVVQRVWRGTPRCAVRS